MNQGMNRQTYEQITNIVDRKDNTWLQLDVCPVWRDTRRCPEGDRCCHAHPPENIEILESNRVVSCYDDVKKGTCRRSDCKFFHPPNHLKNVVNTNGRNNLRLRNELKQQLKSQVGQMGVAMGPGSVAMAPAPFLAPTASYLPASPLYPVTSWHEQLQMQMQMPQQPPVISAPPTTREPNPLLVSVPLLGGGVPMDSTPRPDSPPPPPGTNLAAGAKKRSRTPDVDTANQKFQPLVREVQQDHISPKAKRLSPPRITDLDPTPDMSLSFPFTPLQICPQPKRNQEIPLDLTTYPTFLPQQTYNYDTTYQTMLLNPPPGYMLPTTYQMFPPSFNYNYPQYPAYQYSTYPTSLPITPTQARLPGEGLNIPTITTNRSTPH